MQLCKFFKVMAVIIVLALTYIHMQMQIVDLAYRGQQKELQIRQLIEDNGNTTYKILMLKSANHLGVAMLEEETGMQFADSHDIVEIAASRDLLSDGGPEASRLVKRENPLTNLLSFGRTAEARTDD